MWIATFDHTTTKDAVGLHRAWLTRLRRTVRGFKESYIPRVAVAVVHRSRIDGVVPGAKIIRDGIVGFLKYPYFEGGRDIVASMVGYGSVDSRKRVPEGTATD